MEQNLDINECISEQIKLPTCENHNKFQNEFVCFDNLCEYSRKPLCQYCFRSTHQNLDHPRFEIRHIIDFLHQHPLIIKENIIESMTCYNAIPELLNTIENKIMELKTMKNGLIQIKSRIDSKMEEYNTKFNKDLISFTKKNSNKKKNIPLFLEELMKIIEKKSENTLKFVGFPENELKKFSDYCKQVENYFGNPGTSSPKISYKFDINHKAADIEIYNGKTAIRTTMSLLEDKFCAILPEFNTTSQITFKINKINYGIALGISKYDFVIGNRFNLYAPLTQRGHYLVTSNGYTWSDSSDDENNKQSSFVFGEGDTICVRFEEDKEIVIFKNLKQEKTKFFNILRQKNEILVFTVALGGIGDHIEILE